MKESRIRLRTAALLVFTMLVAMLGIFGEMPTGAASPVRRVFSTRAKECYYGSGVYSMGACRDGQRCVRGVNDEDYWQDDSSCDQTSTGSGGFRQI
jgi:hypothetical protein